MAYDHSLWLDEVTEIIYGCDLKSAELLFIIKKGVITHVKNDWTLLWLNEYEKNLTKNYELSNYILKWKKNS